MKISKSHILSVFLLLVMYFSLSAQNDQYGQYEDYNSYNEYDPNNPYDQNNSYNNSASSNYSHPLAGVSEKVVSNMQQLKNTRFMQEYVAMQIEIEETIKLVKSNQHLYSSEDISQIRIAYRTTATEFNKVLSGLKKDLLNGKYKSKDLASFNQSLEQKLFRLTRFYQTNFKEPIEVIMTQGGDEVVSSDN